MGEGIPMSPAPCWRGPGLRAGPGWGRVLTGCAARRLDDRDKMANLPGAIKGLYPETLSPEQLEKLRGFKIQTRITNEKYLRTHREVALLLNYFTDPRLPNKIHMQLIKEKKAA
ncbi:RIIAD1 [Cervus elaphus hippelaphus]|uniref:RIIAD1 n=1 Tax=Cervus elaphus hippelaphus TaxID=46360 RepID=A0A212CFH7_CEREH|nr:RIIAD1 [Cervus elaphus hippelaphus]